MAKNLSELLGARESIQYRGNTHLTPAMGWIVSNEFAINAFQVGEGVGMRSGFIFGESVWGVDNIGADVSPLAAEYGIA